MSAKHDSYAYLAYTLAYTNAGPARYTLWYTNCITVLTVYILFELGLYNKTFYST